MKSIRIRILSQWSSLPLLSSSLMMNACQLENFEEKVPPINTDVYNYSVKSQKFKTLDPHCFNERFIQPPRAAKAKGKGQVHDDLPRYFLQGPWAEWLDYETLRIEFNKKDIDFSVSVDTQELVFSNPGKSRAVIDVHYCLQTIPIDDELAPNDDETISNDDETTPNDLDDPLEGVIEIDDPVCDAVACGDLGL
jgi:hypothetical protein